MFRATTILCFCALIGLALSAACASAPERDSFEERRIVAEHRNTTLTVPERPGHEVTQKELPQLVRDLDDPEIETFSQAKVRLRQAQEMGVAYLCNQRFPRTSRGRKTAIELIMLAPPPKTLEGDEGQDNPQYQHFRQRMADLISNSSSTTELKIQAAIALRQLNDPADRDTFVSLLENDIRELRWIAAERFRSSLKEIDLEFMKHLLTLLLSSDVEVRSDSAVLFNGVIQELASVATDKIEMPSFFNPRASEVVRSAQQRTWDTWVENHAPKLLAKAAERK